MTAVRELKEETGYSCKARQQLALAPGLADFIIPCGKDWRQAETRAHL